MKRFIFCLLLSVMTFSLSAEEVSKEQTLQPFTSIVASDQFQITIKEGTEYKIALEMDSRVADFCEYNVKGSILYIQLNEREFSKELKAELRKTPLSAQSLRAVLTVPSNADISSISADEEVKFRSEGCFSLCGKLSFNLSEKSSVSSFSISAPDIEVNLSNSSKFDANLKSNNVDIKVADNSEANVETDAANCKINTNNSAKVSVKGNFTNLNIDTQPGLNWPKIAVEGTAETLIVYGKGYADIDLRKLHAKTVEAALATCNCKVNVSDSLKIEMESGAKLYYEGTPNVNIGKINASTVGHFADIKE